VRREESEGDGDGSSSRVRRLFAALRENGDAEALVYGGRSYSFAELDRLSRRYAAGLASFGIRRGDRVAVFAESSPELVVSLLGHYRSGVIHVPINTRYRAEEARHILLDSGARVILFASGSEQAAVLESIGPLPGLDRRIAIGARPAPDGCVAWDDLLDRDPAAAFADPVAGDAEIAVLVYTSGTTGKSKGAALSFRALVDNTSSLTTGWRFAREDRLALALPLFHVHGLCIGIHGALLHGMAILLSGRFDAAEIVRQFEAEGATVFMGVPTMYVRLLEHLDAHPEAAKSLANARLFTSGSAPLPAADFARFEHATGHRILERYGMTETLFTLTNPYAGERRAGTVGFPVDGCAVRIVDEAGRDVPDGEPGEILVESNGQMTEYWGRESDTRAAFRGGWFVTGDVGQRDADGFVRILGRQSVDVIKSGGFKISAREIEDVLAALPRIREVAVVGAADPLWGERVVAAVVLRDPGEEAGIAAEVDALCGRSLADYKRPKEIRIVPELPRNALGKVQKHRIVEELFRKI
jgi:acyl-CoA synthetase (AMP-forming)/AMP-acid ligase II